MKPVRRYRTAVTAALLLAVAPVLAGCGDRGADEDRSGEITALHPWVRVPIAPAPADTGETAAEARPVTTAAYLVIQNPTDREDALVGVETAVAENVEIHAVIMDDGVMRMRRVDEIPIPAAGEAVLEPGGYHIMLIGLLDPLAVGDSVPLSLRLRNGRVMNVLAPVREGPPGP